MVIAEGVAGDLVECGVFAGAQAAATALAVMESGESRRVHLFDTFTGIPAAGPHDREFIEAGHPAGLSACSIAQVRGYMDAWGIPADLLVYHEGLFADTVPTADLGAIAMLRLDGDLYDSTKVCIEYLYPKLSKGGVLVADDFGLSGCRKAVSEFFEATGFPPAYFVKC